jgi:hypothetical protein
MTTVLLLLAKKIKGKKKSYYVYRGRREISNRIDKNDRAEYKRNQTKQEEEEFFFLYQNALCFYRENKRESING